MSPPLRFEISYVVARRDVASMYLGSWAARIAAAPGLAMVTLGILALPNGGITLAEDLQELTFGLGVAILAPLVLVYMLSGMYGTRALIGRRVDLIIDDSGVRGWPLAPYEDRSWPRLRKVRRLWGVITLPFRQFGTRAGWVVVPQRALTPDELNAFLAFLRHKDLI